MALEEHLSHPNVPEGFCDGGKGRSVGYCVYKGTKECPGTCDYAKKRDSCDFMHFEGAETAA